MRHGRVRFLTPPSLGATFFLAALPLGRGLCPADVQTLWEA
jgi:hypothetical protein